MEEVACAAEAEIEAGVVGGEEVTVDLIAELEGKPEEAGSRRWEGG